MTCIQEGRSCLSTLAACNGELVNLMHDEGESESVLCEPQSRDKRKRKSDESIIRKEEEDDHLSKPYDCRFCPMRFTKSQALGGHMNRHRQEREKEQYQNARDIISMHQQPRGFPPWTMPPSQNIPTGLAMGRGTQMTAPPLEGSHANFNMRLPTTSNTSPGSPSNVYLPSGSSSNNPQSQWQNLFAQVNAKSVQQASLSAVDNTTMLQGRGGTREAINLSVLNARQPLGNYAGNSSSNYSPSFRGSGGDMFGCGPESVSPGAGFPYGRTLDTSGFQQTQGSLSYYEIDELRKQMTPANQLPLVGDLRNTSGLPTLSDPKRVNNQMYMISTPAVGTFQYTDYGLGSDQQLSSSLPSSANLPQSDQFGNINPMQTFQQDYGQPYSDRYNLPLGIEKNVGAIKEELQSGSLDVAHGNHGASGVDDVSPSFSALSTKYRSADFSSTQD